MSLCHRSPSFHTYFLFLRMFSKPCSTVTYSYERITEQFCFFFFLFLAINANQPITFIFMSGQSCGVFIFPANEVWGKVLFSQACVQNADNGVAIPALHCRWYPSMPCSRVSWGGTWSQGVWLLGGAWFKGVLLLAGRVAFCCGLLL